MGRQKIGLRVFFRPVPGLNSFCSFHPQLTLWATVSRRSAAINRAKTELRPVIHSRRIPLDKKLSQAQSQIREKSWIANLQLNHKLNGIRSRAIRYPDSPDGSAGVREMPLS
jgi:hypothetical protein